MEGGIFVQAFVYLLAALLVVPLARRTGLGSVLGYLLAGLLIGPSVMGLVGDEGEEVMHFAEFGVVMMLFLVGLELEPERLWRLRKSIVGLGGAQVLGTAVVVGGVATAFGLPWQQALALGLIFAMSSTAIALQSLTERGLLRTDAGQKSFSVLLFQDIAIIPILAGFPLLATLAPSGADAHETWIDGIPAWAHGAVVLLAILGVVIGGRFLSQPFFRAIASTGLREMFTAAALLLVIGVTLLMGAVGLSPALGTFLAGVVLASSEYRHELESDIEPFKGLLLGLFFMAVGASLDVASVAADPLRVLGILLGVVVLKAVVLYALGRAFGSARDQAARFALSLSQIGEFAFVLFSFALLSGVLPEHLTKTMVAVTALSMALSPFVTAFGERFVIPRLGAAPAESRAADPIDEENPVIIAGYGRFGQIAGRFVRSHGFKATVLDVDSDQVELLRRFGTKVFFGDASRIDLLRSAGAGKARLLILAVDDHAKALEIVHTVRKHFPHLEILARARGRTEAYELIRNGVSRVYRETFDTSLRVGVDALEILGVHAHQAHRAARTFKRQDESFMMEMAHIATDQQKLVTTVRERTRELERQLRLDASDDPERDDHAWDSEPLRAAAIARAEQEAKKDEAPPV
jgi:monovalent cation:H+ antiporter-2, CPA2 family